MFSWLGKLISPVIQTVSKFAKPVITKVSEFAKPLWTAAKKVGSFIPGASEAMEAVEGIGGSLLGSAESEYEGAQQDVRDMGEAIQDTSLRTLRDTRGELEEGVSGLSRRGQRLRQKTGDSFKRLLDTGRQLKKTITSRDAWGDMYGGVEDEEDNNYRRQRAKARASRRRQQYVEYDE